MSEETMTVDITSQHIVINQDRSVAVPSLIKKSIVQRDHNIERLTFDCPRYWYGKDISTLNIYANYISVNQKAKGDDPGSSLCENVVIDENDQDMMHFDWVITNNVSQDVGGLLFLVCAKSVDSDGNEDVHWNSHLCKDLEVQEGLEASDSIVKKYPDVIEQIFQRLDNVDGVSPEQIAAAVEEYLVGNPPSGMTADEKAQLNKNTEDISSLSEENAELKGDIEELKQGCGSGSGGSGSGVTTAQASSLWSILQKTAFAEQLTEEEINTFKTSWGIATENIPATGISLNKTTLSFTTSATQNLTATVEPLNSTDKVTWESSNTGIATVSGGVVTPVSNGSCTITAKAGSYSASCAVTVAMEGEITTYTVTNNLTNVSTDNPVNTVNENSGYTANLTADTDYTIDLVTVTMGGVDVTSDVYTNGTIVISAVTGNVVITASAIQSGSTEEIVLLKSVTGDGNSYIDTEVLADVGHRYEFSMKLSEPTKYFFGADMYNVGTPYKNLYLSNAQKMSLQCMINGSNIGGIGTWNGTDANLLTNKQIYFVMKSGLQAVYLDAEYTTQQTNAKNGTTSFGDIETLPIIPLYLFKVNYNEQTNPGNAANYVPADTTVYWLKIYDDSKNTLLHEFVPAKQGTKIGMYDTVSQKFHENKGTGTFVYEEVSA